MAKKHSEQKIIIKIGKRIKELRLKHNISQEQLAFETGLPRVQIGRIERGEINTTIGTLVIICRELYIQPKDLFDFED